MTALRQPRHTTAALGKAVIAPGHTTVAVGNVMAAIAMIAWLLTPSFATAQSDAELAAEVRATIDTYNRHTSIPVPVLAVEDMEDLLDDQVVKLRRQLAPDATGDRKSVVSYYITEQSRDRAWVAALDVHYLATDRLTEVWLENDGKGNSTWYQHVALPWPVHDRHWVIDIHKGIDLAQATDGDIWEHWWILTEDGPRIAEEVVAAGRAGNLKPKDIKDAVYLPANTGAWVMCRIGDRHTLLIYHVTAVFGGAIPDSWVASFAYPQLDKMLREVAERSEQMPEHYDGVHDIIFGGDGIPVPPFRED